MHAQQRAYFAYDQGMGRPYGKTKRPRTKAPRSPKSDNTAFKIKLRGKDGAPLSVADLRDGLFEALHRLAPFAGTHRAKWASLYLTMVDEKGKEVLLDPSGEWEIPAYRSAADEYKQ